MKRKVFFSSVLVAASAVVAARAQFESLTNGTAIDVAPTPPVEGIPVIPNAWTNAPWTNAPWTNRPWTNAPWTNGLFPGITNVPPFTNGLPIPGAPGIGPRAVQPVPPVTPVPPVQPVPPVSPVPPLVAPPVTTPPRTAPTVPPR